MPGRRPGSPANPREASLAADSITGFLNASFGSVGTVLTNFSDLVGLQVHRTVKVRDQFVMDGPVDYWVRTDDSNSGELWYDPGGTCIDDFGSAHLHLH